MLIPPIPLQNDPAIQSVDRLRYARQLQLPEFGLAGQQRLQAARVLCIGCGGLGSPVALYLAAAGVGTLGLVDADTVGLSNLQRQILHGNSTIGQRKVDSARARLLDLNPTIQVQVYPFWLTADNALPLLAEYDLVIDGSDNFPTRYLVDDACTLLGKPHVYGSVFQYGGQVAVFWEKYGPCYRDLLPVPPPPEHVPSCAEAGILGVLPGTIGCLQATEALKLLAGVGEPLLGRLLLYDALAATWQTIRLRKNPNRPAITALTDYAKFCGQPLPVALLTDHEVLALQSQPEALHLLDVREPVEWAQEHLVGAQHIPLALLPEHLATLDKSATYVVYCQMGRRSAQAVTLLQAAGFERVFSLQGGLQTASLPKVSGRS
jgi:molybdopterin/thiamine biosynthesis adenylyltransferase/rhodanese-related sulfurtransferase